MQSPPHNRNRPYCVGLTLQSFPPLLNLKPAIAWLYRAALQVIVLRGALISAQSWCGCGILHIRHNGVCAPDIIGFEALQSGGFYVDGATIRYGRPPILIGWSNHGCDIGIEIYIGQAGTTAEYSHTQIINCGAKINLLKV